MSSLFEQDDSSVGARLCLLREREGLSQSQMADSLSVSLRTFQNYERGDRPISKAVLGALMSMYNVDINWLLSGSQKSSGEALQKIDTDLFTQIVARLRSEDSELRGIKLDLIIGEVIGIYNRSIALPSSQRDDAVDLQVATLSQIALQHELYNLESIENPNLNSAKENIKSRLQEVEQRITDLGVD